jgi:hypothetical protein
MRKQKEFYLLHGKKMRATFKKSALFLRYYEQVDRPVGGIPHLQTGISCFYTKLEALSDF